MEKEQQKGEINREEGPNKSKNSKMNDSLQKYVAT